MNKDEVNKVVETVLEVVVFSALAVGSAWAIGMYGALVVKSFQWFMGV